MDTYLITLLSDQQPRRMRVIENILTNRHTVTTLFWGLRYGILNWLGSDRQLVRADFDGQLRQMQDDGLLQLDNQFILLTSQGKAVQAQFLSRHYQPRFTSDYLNYQVNAAWPRLMFASQVISEFSYENAKYAPISFEDHELRYVKRWFAANKSAAIIQDFKDELTGFLGTLSETEATFMTELLVGHDSPGLSIDQLTGQLKLPSIDGEIMANDLIVGLMQYADQQTTLLKQLFADLHLESPMSHSGYVTYQLFVANHSIAQIEQQRFLKLSTVREHLLEAAIFDGPQFPYQRLLTAEQLADFDAQYAGNIDDWQVQNVSGDKNLDFFNFRLFQIMRSTSHE